MQHCHAEVPPPYTSENVLGSKCLHHHFKQLSATCKSAVEKYNSLEHRIERECNATFAQHCPSMLNKEFNEHTINETCIRENWHKLNGTCKHLLQRWEYEHTSSSLRKYLSQHIYVFIPTCILFFVVLFACLFLCCASCCALCCKNKSRSGKINKKKSNNGYEMIDIEMVQPEQEQMLNETDVQYISQVPTQQNYINSATTLPYPGMNGGQQFYVMYPQTNGAYPMYVPQQQQPSQK